MSIKTSTFVDNSAPQCDAEWLNSARAEVNNVILSTGDTLSGSADTSQLGKSIAAYSCGGDFFSCTGAANTYALAVVGSKKAPTAYFDGMRVRFRPSANNTSSSTANVASLGAKNIYLKDGTTTLRADNLSTNRDVELVYDTTLNAAAGAFMITDAGVTIEGIYGTTIASVGNTTYYVLRYAPYAHNIFKVIVETTSGTVDVAVKVNSTTIHSFTSVTTTAQTYTASPVDAVAVGDDITIVTTNNSSAANLVVQVYYDEVR